MTNNRFLQAINLKPGDELHWVKWERKFFFRKDWDGYLTIHERVHDYKRGVTFEDSRDIKINLDKINYYQYKLAQKILNTK